MPARPYARPLLTAFVLLCVVLAAEADGVHAQNERGEPRVVEMDETPMLRNGEAMARALERLYPPTLRAAEIEGSVMVWIYIDELGRVRETRLEQTSGYLAFDEAAEQVAGLMSFQPARKDAAAIPVWIPMGINFHLPHDDEAHAHAAAPTPSAPPAAVAPPARKEPVPTPTPARQHPDPDDGPTVTPMTVPPTLTNQAEVSAALMVHYPPALRDAGIGGTVQVWVFISDEGVVQRVQLNQSSGYDAFDEAALRVARTLRFTPAMNGDEAVPVWVAIPITFAVE